MREWLNAQAAGGYVTYDPASARFTLPPEQAYALADESSPASVPGLFRIEDHPELMNRLRGLLGED